MQKRYTLFENYSFHISDVTSFIFLIKAAPFTQDPNASSFKMDSFYCSRKIIFQT